MNDNLLVSALVLCWRWSVFLMFPLLVFGYVEVLGVPLSDFDNGVNHHKWILVCLYLLYVVLWWRLNRRVLALITRRR
ncbi:hypothetical protein PU634_00725 [Oceanimonas pelagia]|uniref:Uncharacterized protein n=1 Tax=Oceanimonas pelagia TaxID=3028314 RepID=A0AA50KMM6_9GAMM|nr:hypothetical protein [Oceanimonas pelagia]WMC10921.1 hypothetical protein PU634_00725 [Oceanimonas pelagia]